MKTVFVGLSGGVDSAVSAYLLKKEGYEIVGAFIRGWEPDFLPCTGVRDRLEAMRVAAHLGIPFVTYDLEEEYKRDVVDYFVNEYKAGRTPNPDVMCNRTIKFGAFAKRARADGADFIATGHYASTTEGELCVSKDKQKDQTYFLWTLTQEDLRQTLFPVGGFEKKQVRALAHEAGLPNATRKDSQGLCFLGHVDMHAFLKRYIPTKPGAIQDESGKILGEHDGAWFYTLGQHVTLGGASARHYVVKKDVDANTLTVSDTPLGEAASTIFELTNSNWISGNVPRGKMLGRFRYRQPLLGVTIDGEKAVFDEPQLIASGQSLVVYDEKGSTCLGGGIIA